MSQIVYPFYILWATLNMLIDTSYCLQLLGASTILEIYINNITNMYVE